MKRIWFTTLLALVCLETLAVTPRAIAMWDFSWLERRWPGDQWAPFFHAQHPDVIWGQWEATASLDWMQRAIAKVRKAYPDLPLLFSFDSQELDKYKTFDTSFLDLYEPHIWMANQNSGEFNAVVGYNYEKISLIPAKHKNF